MKEIVELLRETMGFHAPTIGSTPVEQAVRDHMSRHGLKATADYLKLLQNSRAEWLALVESCVVPETWFFRDREPFHALARLAQGEWLPAHPSGKLRMLSVPCSTGEEPYSISMAVLDSGFPGARFEIDALDISPAAIAAAQRANYGKNSFRGKDLAFRDRHFKFTSKSWCLKAPARQPVRFQTANLLDEHCLPKADVYDFIFCRNLLIYFDRCTQERALLKLNRLLKENGVLFVGAAEVPIATKAGFVPARLPLSFACRKARVDGSSAGRGGRPTRLFTQPKPNDESQTGRSTPAPLSFPGEPPPVDLVRARQMAEAGRLDEAAQICESHLKKQGASAQVFYLLGLAHDTTGADARAGEYYRKALYLDPDHYETLVQWASLSKKIGDGEHAMLLHERAERLQANHWLI